MTERRLEGRVAIVTGASRGIGEAVARLFAREGAAVAVAARTEQVFDERLPGTIHETVDAIEADGGRAVAIRADLADEGDIDRLVDEARAALGPIDLLVNNAALTVPGRPPARDGAPNPQRPPRPPNRRAAGAHDHDAARIVPRLPAQGVPAALPDRALRELPTRCSSCSPT